MPMQQGVAGAALVACVAVTAQAQDALTLSDIIISANRTPTEAARVASSVTVLERAQIEASGAASLVDLLGDIPGVSIGQEGPPGSGASVSIRGAGARYVVVRIDGIEVSDPTQPQIATNFGTLLTGDIERVEVLRGSQSLLYGGRAVGGVIDITTRRAVQDGPGLSAAAEAGSFNTLNALGTASYGFERGSVALTVQRFQTSGFSAADRRAGNTERDGNRNTVISGSGEIDLTDTLTLEAAARYGRNRVEYDGFQFPVGLVDRDFVQEIESWAGRIGGRHTAFDGRLTQSLSVQYFASDREQRDDFAGRFDGRRTRVDYLASADLGDRVGLVAGADWQRETVSITGGIDEAVRIGGGFAQISLTPVDSVTLTGGLRYDDHSTFGGNTSWRLTGAWTPVAPLRLRATAATGFRPPSPFELFDPTFGNRDLVPEQSLSLDAGADLTLSAFGRPAVLSATVFRIEIDDLIGFDSATFVSSQVPGQSRRQGVELSGRISPVDWLDVTGRYTYTDARNQEGGRLPRVPYHDLGVGVTVRPAARLRVTASANYVQGAVDGFPLGSLPAYTLVRAQASYALTDTAEVFVRGDNLLDQRYQTVRGYGTAPLSAFAGLRLRF